MAQEEKIRVFLAIELTEALKQEALEPVEKLRAANPYFRFLPPENWHLTLHFFGSLSPEELEKAKKAVTKAVQNTAPFSFRLRDFGTFPNERAPRILWIGTEGGREPLLALKKEINSAIRKINLPVEDRKFHPHLTIARVREEKKHSKTQFSSTPFTGRTEQTVEHLTFFRSDLLPGGARYTPLETIPFKP